MRIFGEFDPDWEVDPTHLTIQEKLGELLGLLLGLLPLPLWGLLLGD